MPRIRIPGFRKSPKSDDESPDDVEPPSNRGSISRGGSISFNKANIANGNGSRALTSLMSANKNPSTIFTPPFGTNVEEHHSKLGEHAQNLWQYNKITDLTVKLQGVEYACHKTVLSCYSKYFKELLLDQKGAVNVIYLRLPSVSNAAFEVLLEYMYTSKLNLTCQNIGEVYTASRKLGIDGALVLCTKILTGQTKHGVHAVYLYVTAKKQHMRDCAAKAMKIMTRRFEQIVGTPEFLDLDFSQVKEYLSQDVLATRSEVIIFLAALKWLSVKYLEREQHAVDLIGCVRFQMMTLNEILACFSPPLLPGVLEHKMIKDKLLLATCYVAATTVNEEKRFESYACKPRRYLLPREPIILWDPSIFDPDRHAMYQEEMAATTIQAAYRGYKTRKSVESDRAAGLLQPSERYLEDFTEFVPPKDEDDETIIHRIGSKSDSRTRQSVFENIRKSIVSFMSASDEEKDEKVPFANKNEDSSVRHGVSVSRSSSVDTLANHINTLTENTEIKKYTSDTVFDMNSHEFTKSFSNEHDTVHKIYTKPNKEEEEDFMRSVSSASDENQLSSELVKGSIIVTGGFGSEDTQDESEE